jgi:hypothetical protein
MNQTEILILFIGLIVSLTALELLFNAQKISFKPHNDNIPNSMPISKAILDDNDGKGIYHGIAHPKDDNWRNISDDDIPSPNTDDLTVEDDDDYEW